MWTEQRRTVISTYLFAFYGYLPGCTKISREKEEVKISKLIKKLSGLKQKVLHS